MTILNKKTLASLSATKLKDISVPVRIDELLSDTSLGKAMSMKFRDLSPATKHEAYSTDEE